MSAPAETYLVLHELDGRPCHVRREAVTGVACTPSSRGVDAAIYVRGSDEPLRAREQADDVLCELGVFLGRCRMCLNEMPSADRFGGVCQECLASIAGWHR